MPGPAPPMAPEESPPAQGIELGSLETKVLGIVRRLGAASTRDVMREMRSERDLAYTTIATTLDRLHRKGLLLREEVRGRGGPLYIYRLANDEGIKARAVRWAVDRLLEAFGSAIISKIYERLEEVPREEIESIKARLEKARKEGVGG